MQWYLKVLRQYADFTGRARRTEYWMYTLFTIIATIIAFVLDGLIFGFGQGPLAGYGFIYALYALATIIPSLAVTARRLHDTDRSGWWILIGLVPIVGGIILLVFTVLEGTRGQNQYGPDPKATVYN
ncbi:DUF805 domain-containing protein [Pseudonocardia sp. TRM90224]|uniref:DUF805 domain-containing protein n=1 Tax=Pseudonocardia sp. TRM90224 TaxID=2812678 RepID=UPI001E424758|nr:DUF805 domain-containing protein [Pseudonocardia sp. TRM90224]